MYEGMEFCSAPGEFILRRRNQVSLIKGICARKDARGNGESMVILARLSEQCCSICQRITYSNPQASPNLLRRHLSIPQRVNGRSPSLAMEIDQSLENEYRDYLLKSVIRGNELLDRGNRVVLSMTEAHPLQRHAKGVEYGDEALAASTFFLGAATNSLQSLQLQTVGPNPGSAIAAGAIEMHITINGMCGLLRQILENTALARWVINTPTDEILTRRGYAATWNNYDEAIKNLRALKSPRLPKQILDFQEIIDDGLRLDLLVESPKSPYKYAPRHPIDDTSGLLRDVEIPLNLIERFQESWGANCSNAEWLYRWLSGMAHGLPWVLNLEMLSELAAVMLAFTRPSYIQLGNSAIVGIQLIEEVIERFEH
jgi:hypothetical protein